MKEKKTMVKNLKITTILTFFLLIITLPAFATNPPLESELASKKLGSAKMAALDLFDPLLIELQEKSNSKNKNDKKKIFKKLKFIQEELYKILSLRPSYLQESINKIKIIMENYSQREGQKPKFKDDIINQFEELSKSIPPHESYTKNLTLLDTLVKLKVSFNRELW